MNGITFYLKTGSLYELQVHQKRPSCQTCDNTFYSLSEYLLPFIFTREASSNDITSFTVKDVEDNVIATLDNELVSIRNSGSVDYIVGSFQELGETLECDIYYYELTFGSEVYYSELFRVVNKDLDLLTENIAVNGTFTGDLSGWTVDGATWQSGGGGRASLSIGNTISQTAPGESLVKVVVNVLDTFTSGMEFKFGSFTFEILPGDNVFYVPSGVTYTIKNNDTTDFNDMVVEYVQIYAVEKVDCYNLVIARNSCNKNNIPYVETGYTDVYILDGELSEPEYPRDDESTEDFRKDKNITSIKISKKWLLTLSNPYGVFEPLVDELNTLPANDCIYIYNHSWQKIFAVFEGTLDVEISTEWNFELKCNASIGIIITENLVNSNSCCEEIEDLDCCDSFLYEYEFTPIEEEVREIALTIPDGNCAGLRYYLQTFVDDVFDSEQEFTSTITYEDDGTDNITFKLSGRKFGCPDIIYDALS